MRETIIRAREEKLMLSLRHDSIIGQRKNYLMIYATSFYRPQTTSGWMDARMGAWMDGWIDRWTDGWMNGEHKISIRGPAFS